MSYADDKVRRAERLRQLAGVRLQARPIALTRLLGELDGTVGTALEQAMWDTYLHAHMPVSVLLAERSSGHEIVDRWLISQIDDWAKQHEFLDATSLDPLPPIDAATPPITAPAEWHIADDIGRADTLRIVLLNHLRRVRAEGRGCPSAGQVLSEWTKNPPTELARVTPQAVTFRDEFGAEVTVGAEKLRDRIRNLTKPGRKKKRGAGGV